MLFNLIFVSIALILITKSDSSSSGSSRSNNKQSLKPKNLILLIGDGLGPTYNAAYRIFKGIDSTILDDYLVGTFATRAFNQSIIDSAASANAISTGILTRNTQAGTDININPISNIFEAAKEKGKGIGIVSNNRITDATPAAFSAHTAVRRFEDLIARQQGLRINGDIDVLFGGGSRHFDGSRNDNTFNLIEDYLDFGWNSLSINKSDLLLLDKDDIPSIGLFSNSQFPDYLTRKYDAEYSNIPNLIDMTKKALELLDENYGKRDDDGFMLMVESGQIDWGGHENDLPYLLNEMDEYYQTIDYVINEFISNRKQDDTLVVMLADHETGGLSLGRESQWNKEELINGPNFGKETINKDTRISQTDNVFHYDPLVVPPLIDELGNTHMYDFFIEPAIYSTRTASSVALMVQAVIIENDEFNQVFDIIETYYIEQLTQHEKNFIISCYNRLNDEYPLINSCLTKILNIRMNAGWTTFGHSGSDLQISSIGPKSHKFRGFNGNVENIGKKLIDIFDLKNEIETNDENLKNMFLSNILVLCDNSTSLDYLDVISWPNGNYKYPGICFYEN